jgi:hypothetical protein
MEHQEAVEVLKSLLDKNLTAKEQEAVMTAIGVLSWGSLYKSRIKAQKARREKGAKW